MKVFVVGGGAREHALCRALSLDPAVDAMVCAPGNAGTAEIAEPSRSTSRTRSPSPSWPSEAAPT